MEVEISTQIQMRKAQNLAILIIMVICRHQIQLQQLKLECLRYMQHWAFLVVQQHESKKLNITETYRKYHHDLGFITCYSIRHAQ